jgi:hypothetical protein
MKKIIYIATIILSVGLISCEGYLDKEPVMSQSDVLTLSDYEGLNNATAGAYSPLYSVNWYGANFILATELRGGNAKNPTNTSFVSGRYNSEYSWNFTPEITSPLWNTAYYVISNVNNVINNLGGKESTDVSKQDLDNIKAECLFLRALAYFDLVRMYAQPYTSEPQSLGVPVVLVSELGKPARESVETVYNRVVEDLTEAESIIAANYIRAGVDDPAAAVTKPAIQALLSRVYLYMGNWQKAADYATLIINNSKYHLFTVENYASQWGKNTADANGEVIFEIYGSRRDEYWGNWDVIPWLVNPNGYADVASSADLRNLYEENDIRGTVFESHADAPDHFWTAKYPGKENTNRQENNTIVLRLSEMYLNRAEAIIRGNLNIPGVSATTDLQAVASNRGATPQAASLTGVLTERRKELCFEGHIVFDLARTGTSLTRVDYNGAEQNRNIAFPDKRWALPIPKREIDANENIVQNPL